MKRDSFVRMTVLQHEKDFPRKQFSEFKIYGQYPSDYVAKNVYSVFFTYVFRYIVIRKIKVTFCLNLDLQIYIV